jgi:hypothetical protein
LKTLDFAACCVILLLMKHFERLLEETAAKNAIAGRK